MRCARQTTSRSRESTMCPLTVGFQKFIRESGPSPWELWTCLRGHLEVGMRQAPRDIAPSLRAHASRGCGKNRPRRSSSRRPPRPRRGVSSSGSQWCEAEVTNGRRSVSVARSRSGRGVFEQWVLPVLPLDPAKSSGLAPILKVLRPRPPALAPVNVFESLGFPFRFVSRITIMID